MLDFRTLETMAEKISGLLPADARVLRDEFRTNVRVLLETTLARMDLVTREEFDAQAAMLRAFGPASESRPLSALSQSAS